MNRRKFLQDSLLMSAGAWAVTQTARAQQITLLMGGRPVPTLVAPGLKGVTPALFAVTAATPAELYYPLSIASGDPRPDGIVLWTKVTPAAAWVPLTWQIATQADFAASSLVLQGALELSASSDYTAKAAVRYGSLKPFTQYYYRFIYSGVASRTGRFKTLPAPGASLSRLRLGYISCQDYTNGYYNALEHLAQEELDFVVHLGDYMYETIGDPDFQGGQVRVIPPLPSAGVVAANLADFRYLHGIYRSDPDLQLAHERFAFIQVWDDHEFANDSHQSFHPDNTATPGIPKPQLRQQANQAWSEYTAAEMPFYSNRGPLDSLQLNRSFDFGDLMRLVITDERLYRDGPPCGVESSARYLTTGCPERERPTRTMFGYSQRDWFINQVKTAPAIWKIWANEMMAMQLKLLRAISPSGAVYLTLDHWDGYPAERQAVLSQIAGTRNFVAITGDIHSFAAGFLKPSYESVSTPAVGIELVGGSVTSANFEEVLSSATTKLSARIPKDPGITPETIQAIARINNPHIKFFNSSTHGYCTLDITPSALTCEMKQVSTVTSTTSSVQLLRKFTVPRNQIQLIEG